MDYWNALDIREGRRTSSLVAMKDQLIRSEIVKRYVYMDELLSIIILKAYFKQPRKRFYYDDILKTKKGLAFYNHVLESLYLLNKTRLVDALRQVPKEPREIIDRLNSLRNAVSHSLFPAGRYQYRKHKKVLYRGLDVFSIDGFKAFKQDMAILDDYLFVRAIGPDRLSRSRLQVAPN